MELALPPDWDITFPDDRPLTGDDCLRLPEGPPNFKLNDGATGTYVEAADLTGDPSFPAQGRPRRPHPLRPIDRLTGRSRVP